MSKHNRNNRENGQTEQVESLSQVEATTETPATEATPVAVPQSNFVLTYRREHPGARCSYGIAGNPGIVVFDEGLFAGFGQPGFQAPATITLSCEMVPIKVDNKTAKAEAAAQKLIEKAEKAKARIAAAEAKATERKAKAEAALAAARAKVDAAAAQAKS